MSRREGGGARWGVQHRGGWGRKGEEEPSSTLVSVCEEKVSEAAGKEGVDGRPDGEYTKIGGIPQRFSEADTCCEKVNEVAEGHRPAVDAPDRFFARRPIQHRKAQIEGPEQVHEQAGTAFGWGTEDIQECVGKERRPHSKKSCENGTAGHQEGRVEAVEHLGRRGGHGKGVEKEESVERLVVPLKKASVANSSFRAVGGPTPLKSISISFESVKQFWAGGPVGPRAAPSVGEWERALPSEGGLSLEERARMTQGS